MIASRTLRTMRRSLSVSVLAATALVASVLTTASASPAAGAAPRFTEASGTLPDGTEYLIRVPQHWNGTVISDLDFAVSPNEQSFNHDWYEHLLAKGYAASGTRRHPMRWKQYDPRAEIRNLVRVLDVLEEKFGKPRRVLQMGCSGGGAVSLGMGEANPDRVDGVVPLGAQTGVVIGNMWLDLLFTLKSLLAPGSDLPVVGIPPEEISGAWQAWKSTLETAQRTELGRARIALAVTLSQWPTWGSLYPSSDPRPDTADVVGLQHAMYKSASEGVLAAVASRHILEFGAGGIPSWNAGIDYKDFYRNASAEQTSVTRELYRLAGLHPGSELAADIDKINRAPRITADTKAVEYWRVHPRTHAGTPGVPVLQAHTIGDSGLPPVLMADYEAGVHANGGTSRYRQAFVEASGHCVFRASEVASLVETMMRRLDTGRWEASTTPQALNTVGRTLADGQPRFTRFQLPRLNRAFYPDSPGQ